eukprot:3594362-Pleurochrysis_carterae.AAC.1
MTGRHVLNRYLISKSGTPTKYRRGRQLATYQPSAYLLVDHRPSTLNNSLSADILLANLKSFPATVSTSILLS